VPRPRGRPRKIFLCPHCPQGTKPFPSASDLQSHLKADHNLGTEQEKAGFICDWPDCGIGFNTQPKLKRHRAEHLKAERASTSERKPRGRPPKRVAAAA